MALNDAVNGLNAHPEEPISTVLPCLYGGVAGLYESTVEFFKPTDGTSLKPEVLHSILIWALNTGYEMACSSVGSKKVFDYLDLVILVEILCSVPLAEGSVLNICMQVHGHTSQVDLALKYLDASDLITDFQSYVWAKVNDHTAFMRKAFNLEEGTNDQRVVRAKLQHAVQKKHELNLVDMYKMSQWLYQMVKHSAQLPQMPTFSDEQSNMIKCLWYVVWNQDATFNFDLPFLYELDTHEVQLLVHAAKFHKERLANMENQAGRDSYNVISRSGPRNCVVFKSEGLGFRPRNVALQFAAGRIAISDGTIMIETEAKTQ